MNKDLTEIVFILDRSGSMAGLEDDTVGGFNAMVEKQKKEPGTALLSAVLFSDRSEVLYDRTDIRKIEPMTDRQYRVGGCTALLDAIGGAVHHIANVHRYAREEDRPARTIFVITTDGMENASRKYGGREVRRMVEDAKKQNGWEFIFLAANIDAAETAESIGIPREASMNYTADSADTTKLYRRISRAVGAMRGGAPMEACLAEMKKEE